MLYFITGKPGNGKTLYLISKIKNFAQPDPKAEKRKVYYHGIELTEKGKDQLGWIQLEDPQKWNECPDGSIVVIDEVQQHWPKDRQKKGLPEAVQQLETHRHRGFDLFYATQDPLLVDVNIRKLVWEHTHIQRTYGLEAATLYRWKQKTASVDSKSDRKESLAEKWLYPKDCYGLYKSAELHTATKQLPIRQVAVIGSIGVAFLCALYYVFTGWGDPEKSSSDTVATAITPKNTRNSRNAGGDPWDVSLRKPRLDGYQQTAPLYDRLQRIASQPSAAGCMEMKRGKVVECTCTTSQGSKLEIPIHDCRKMIADGWFDPSKPHIDVKAENIAYLNSMTRGSSGGIRSPGQTNASSTGGEVPQSAESSE